MRKFCSLLMVFISLAANAENEDRARGFESAKSIQERYGSGDGLHANAFEPLSSDEQMQTADGTTFDTRIECESQPGFMRVSILPNSESDIDNISVEMDFDMDGDKDFGRTFQGPFAAVCYNGLQSCLEGSTDGCEGQVWAASESDLALNRTSTNNVGSCYCFNNSCGDSLLFNNSKKVLEDIGTAVARAVQEEHPRIAIGKSKQIDTFTMEFSGQDGSCGSTEYPEEFYGDTSGMEAAGQEKNDEPDSMYSLITTSPAASGHPRTEQSCGITRQIELKESLDPDEILTFISEQGDASVEVCGTNCRDYVVGSKTNRIRKPCGGVDYAGKFIVSRPDLIRSVTYLNTSHDDQYNFRVGNRLLYRAPEGNIGRTPYCAAYGGDAVIPVNADITYMFQPRPPETEVTYLGYLRIASTGHSFSVIRVIFENECDVESEQIETTCGPLSNNDKCDLKDETTDGVETVRNYYRTGLKPLPSSKSFSTGASCTRTFQRDWWETERVYSCESSEEPYDVSFASDRYEAVHSSYDPESGNFDDRRQNNDGSYSTYSMNSSQPEPTDASCMAMCKTRKPRPGEAMGENGSTGKYNSSGPAYDYTYRECSEDFVCPSEEGETVVSPCDCESNFMEAAAVMQSIRITKEDFLCRP